LEYALYIPWLLPSTLIALGLIMTFDIPRFIIGNQVLTGTLVIMLIGYIIIKIPFTLRLIKAAYYGVDPSLEEAARNLGSKPLYTYFKIILPTILPTALGILALNFNGLLDEYDLSVFLYHPFYQPLGIVIKNVTQEGADASGVAMTLVYTVLLMIISALTIYFVYGRSSKKN
jgi:iron(III) transport system permease protein